MDIIHFFSPKKENHKNIDSQIQKRQFLNIIKNLLKNNLIDTIDYNFLFEFCSNGGTLIMIHRYNQIINKICQNSLINNDFRIQFIEVCKNSFIHLYDIFLENKIYNDHIDIDIDKLNKLMIDYFNNTVQFTKDQLNGIKNIWQFLCHPTMKTFGLYGFAGTGKTTLIIKLTTFLLVKNYIRSVVFAAPTNKAVNIMKSKFRNDIRNFVNYKNKNKNNNNNKEANLNEQLDQLEEQGYNIHFLTIHKLLNYKNDFDVEGTKIFIKGKKNNLMKYDLVIIDECSMIPFQIIIHIFEEINYLIMKQVNKIPKIIFVGDPAQLPPVNEKVSIIFSKNKKDFNFELFKRIVSNENKSYKELDDNLRQRFEIIIDNIINQEEIILEQIVRSNNDQVIGLCNNIRAWVLEKIKIPRIGDYIGCKVKIYKYNKEDKIETNWFKNCLNYFSSNNSENISNIILTWTNKQSDNYNNAIRKYLFKKDKLNKFEKGDILILNDFYNIKESIIEDKRKQIRRFYTSEQIKVIDIEEVIKGISDFAEIIPHKLKKIENFTFIEDKFKKIIKDINKNTVRKYNVWKLYVYKLTDTIIENNIPELYQIYVTKDESVNVLEKDKLISANKIKEFRQFYKVLLRDNKDLIELLDKKIIKPLWREWNKRFCEPFCDVSYGASTTIHKSQSSTYYNVFIDNDDLFQNHNDDEAKRCIYTALTRTSNELHILT